VGVEAIELGEARRLGDQLDGAVSAYDEVLAAGAEGETATRAWLGLAKVRQLRGDYAGAREALDKATWPGLAARTALARARVLLFAGEPAEAIAEARRALALAESDALRMQVLELLAGLLVQADPGNAPEARALLEEGLELAGRLNDVLGGSWLQDALGNVCLGVGDFAGAARAFDAYARVCREVGVETELLSADLNRAIVAAERGEDDAAARAANVGARALAAGRKYPLAAARAVEAQARLRAGEPALALLDEALALAVEIENRYVEAFVRGYRLEAWLLLGDRDAAREELKTLEALGAERLEIRRIELAGEPEAARALLGSPDRWTVHRAHQLLGEGEAALAIARAWQAPWHEADDLYLMALKAAPERQPELVEALLALPNPYARKKGLALLGIAEPVEAPLGGPDLISPERLHSALSAIAAAPDEAAIASVALGAAMTAMAATRGYALLYEGGRLARVVTDGLDYAREDEVAFSRSIAERVLFGGRPLYVADAVNDPRWSAAASVAAIGLRAVVCVPLATPDQMLGVLYMDRPDLDPALGPGDLSQLASLGLAAAVALVAARERAAAHARARREQRVLALAGRMVADAANALAHLLEAARDVAGADRACWLEPRDGGWAIARAHPAGIEAPSQGVAAWVAQHGEPVEVHDAGLDEAWRDSRSIHALGLQTIWCLPAGKHLLYLDARRAVEPDPEVLPTLIALLAFAVPAL
jgi:GAF domain-containing protein